MRAVSMSAKCSTHVRPISLSHSGALANELTDISFRQVIRVAGTGRVLLYDSLNLINVVGNMYPFEKPN